MTIPKITPYSGGVANPDGSQTQTEFTQSMFDQLSYEANLSAELNNTVDGINDTATQVDASAASASQSAAAAEAAASGLDYQGLWPDTGGSANKGETWQTQTGGTPTGQYFTALKNTTAYPVSDDVNWRVVLNDQSVGNLVSYQARDVNGITNNSSPAGFGRTIGGQLIQYKIGQVWVTGDSRWTINASSGLDVGGGFFARISNTAYASDFGMVADNFLSDGETENPLRTDSSAAFQRMVDFCETFDYDCFINPDIRGYYLPSPTATSDETTQFTVATTRSMKIVGGGKSTILCGSGGAPATYSNGVNDGSDSILRIHRSNVIYGDFQLRDTPVGLYIGQDPRSPVRSSHTNMNRGDNIWFQNCGTCLLNQPGKTNYNNSLENYQMQGYQIGIHNGLPFHHNDPGQNTDLDVSNRNNYAFFSMNNGWCAVLFDNGDTNTFTSGTIESNNGSSANIGAVGPAPSQIHDGVATAVYSDQTKHVYGVNTHKWVNIECEANTRDLYLDGSGWGFSNVFMDSTKIELGPNGLVPKWTSTDSPAANGKYGNHHMGGMHIKTSIGVIDPFNPTAGVASQDRGVYFDGGRVSDTGGRPTEYNVADNCPQISSITSGTTKHSTLGKIVNWQGRIEFDQPSANTLVITLPNTSQIDNDSNASLVFNLVASGVSSDELARGIFIQTSNIVQISAPTSGWAATGNELNINLAWRQV